MTSWDFLPPTWRPSRSPVRTRQSVDSDDGGQSPKNLAAPSSGVGVTFSATAADTLLKRRQDDTTVQPNDCTVCPSLRSEIDRLISFKVEKEWAVARAVELSNALASLQATLKETQDRLAQSITENDALRQRNADLVTMLNESSVVHQRLMSTSSRCLRCLQTSEAASRAELTSQEQSARYTMECDWTACAGTWMFAERQCAETERELMWIEDQRAHAAMLRAAEDELSEVRALKKSVRSLTREVDHLKVKYRDLKEKGRVHIEDLKATHEENMRRARTTYLRCNPNQAVLMWSFSSVQKSLSGSLDVKCQAARTAKELAVMKQALLAMRHRVITEIASLAADVQGALRICLPVMWQPAPTSAPDVRQGTPHRGASTAVPAMTSRPHNAVSSSSVNRLPSPTTLANHSKLITRGRSPLAVKPRARPLDASQSKRDSVQVVEPVQPF